MNESGRSPRVITSSNLDRNAGREFKLWKSSIHSYAKKSIQRLHDHWIRSKIKCQWIYIWYRAGLAEYIRVVMTYSLLSGRCNDILWDISKWTSAYVPYHKAHQNRNLDGLMRYITMWPISTSTVRIPRVIEYMRSWWRIILVLCKSRVNRWYIRLAEGIPFKYRLLRREHLTQTNCYQNIDKYT